MTLATIGLLLVLGLLGDWAARHLPVPRVTALILLGVVIGPIGVDLLPADREQWFPIVSAIALVMVGFLIGGDLELDRLRDLGGQAALVATVQAVVTAALVVAGLLAFGADIQMALPLGGIAAATAPAAVAAVVDESGRSGVFTRLLLAVVAMDDALSLLLFSVLLAATGILTGTGTAGGALRMAAWELGGAVVLGVCLGIFGALVGGRLRDGRPVLEEALGLVLLCAGIGLWLELSFLLAAVVMGMVVTNLARHHTRSFREIESIEWPFLVLFFVLAGASLELQALTGVGLVAIGFVVLRAGGKVLGGWLGAKIARTPEMTARWVGTALLPQAGVALGLGLLAEEQLPDVGSDILAVVIAATIVFELAGPILTRAAVQRADAA